ncbi:MAG: glycolate oxidase subunit GlcF [Gammaproteobacteria bacterium]|jgi:glycolate oxidase iron-sulfur subunit|nr:glycolate oxidase subunit GlcF [Gammaproteobacteria bacterium]
MQTQISSPFRDTPQGREADSILRSCVHCGFCTATCPTYQLLGDELDGPRGRIYLIKQMFEGQPVTRKTRQHLDRCLTCRSCETTCPSGVRYGRLLDLGRERIETAAPRNPLSRAQRFMLRKLFPYPARVAPLLRLARMLAPVLPAGLRRQVPEPQPDLERIVHPHPRRMLVLEGCVQSVATPRTNAAAARILDRLGIQLDSTPQAGCCGAVSHHLSATEEALGFFRRNIDAWWPHVEQGAEAIVITASGCGTVVKEYGSLLKHDPVYRDKANRISELAMDIAEVLNKEGLPTQRTVSDGQRVAFHSPCTLQHGQQLNGVVEDILQRAGFTLTAVPDAHLCCGSAGTYSILQPELSARLRANKLRALEGDTPEAIATANVGCQMHLASESTVPVRHWIELVDEATTG